MQSNIKKELLETHLDEVKEWMQEENINPDSNFGKEILKQSKLLFEQDEKIRTLDKKITILEGQIPIQKDSHFGDYLLKCLINYQAQMSKSNLPYRKTEGEKNG